MHVEVLSSLDEISASAWNGLHGTDNPFLRHEFLCALERHGCVTPETGWHPRHMLLYDGDRLLAATPAYLKTDSWGEFVFDWAWASAYERAGRPYYPKLISAVPYTPATGPRLLLAADADPALAARTLVAAGRQLCRKMDLSSMHWLFPDPEQASALAAAGLSTRVGCQFHWRNRGYADFDDFLATFSSKKRKNVRRERRQAREQGLTFSIVPGDQVTPDDWKTFHHYYQRTFHAHGNLPIMTTGFFQEIGQALGDRVLMVQGRDASGLIATALLLRSETTLYGRYWGCREELPGVHFETCFYQGIDYCIEQNLQVFEPGAQGEHKIARGFLPTVTRSCHWIADEAFQVAVDDFLRRETAMVYRYMEDLNNHMPYRDPPETTFRPDAMNRTGTE